MKSSIEQVREQAAQEMSESIAKRE